jgi:antitoxin component HigA of HigAB toxin-antitoxin module
MPKPGKQPAPAVVTQIRAIFKRIVKRNKIVADSVGPKVKASKIKPKDRALAVTITRMLKDNKALRTAVRAELKKIGIRPKRKAG